MEGATSAYSCSKCNKVFVKQYNLKRHFAAVHSNPKDTRCGSPQHALHSALKKPRVSSSSTSPGGRVDPVMTDPSPSTSVDARTKKSCELCKIEGMTGNLKVVKSCFRQRIQTLIYENSNSANLNVNKFLNEARPVIEVELKKQIGEHVAIKFMLELSGEYIKMTKDGEEVANKSFNTKMQVVCNEDDVRRALAEMNEIIITKMGEFQERDSAWALISINHLEVNINEYHPVKGSQYLPLPINITRKKACINVQNLDKYCFKWAIISAVHPIVDYPQRPGSYQISDITRDEISLSNGIRLNFAELEFPLKVQNVSVFEQNNPQISVNVFGLEGDTIVGPYYCTKAEKPTHINLLLIQKEEKSHYVWVKNISRLVRNQITKCSSRIQLCNTCLQHFHDVDKLTQHKNECSRMVTVMPTPEQKELCYKNYERQLDVPFVIYADFECILEQYDSCVPDPTISSTTFIQKHTPCAFAYYLKCSFDPSLDKLRVYTGRDCAREFIKALTDEVKTLYYNFILQPKPMKPLDNNERIRQEQSTECHICKKSLGRDRVADHCHFTGQYRGPAHSECDLRFRVPNFFPILFHNFSDYDCHLLVKALEVVEGDINLIPLNKELYISLSKRIPVLGGKQTIDLRFLDSARFMQSSLESLANNLTADDFHTVRRVFPDEEQFGLAIRKGVFPYGYLDSFEKLMETSLPPQANFHNKLTNKECTDAEYEFAQVVWEKFNCETLWDYLKVYLTIDVVVLTDIFENFRKVCKSIYELDPCQYYTAPGLAWDAMLKYTNIKLELLTDYEMHSFIKRGIRGGITQCSHRHSVANNRYMQNYDASKPSSFLMYLDANNLYGWAMSQPMPYADFQWVENVENLDIMSIEPLSEIGYILEVDLDYPETLHCIHNDLPFCPENKTPPGSKLVKLITDLTDKHRYVIHYRNLQQCLKHGLILKKVHRVLQFKQSCWLKKYIDLNTRHRILARNTFEKNFFKLLNNAVYGKTMENVDKRKDVKIVTEWESRGRRLGARALIAKPNFHSVTQLTPNMVAIQMQRVRTFYNKPIYLGFTVLELSKKHMYEFHYDYMKPKYEENLLLNYIDTDSFIYTIQTEDFYNDIKDDIDQYFDTSEYASDNPYNIPLKNKKIVGLMKDENNGRIMREFIGLRAKMYSIDVIKGKTIKKAKGVKRSVVDDLTLDNYRDCLYNRNVLYRNMLVFRSKVHEIYTLNLNKIALSCSDDKRYIRKDGVSTFAWGHFAICFEEEFDHVEDM